MFNLKKVTQLILLLSVNFFSPSVIANQFTMDCGRIIDIDDYKKCTRKKFTESYKKSPASEIESMVELTVDSIVEQDCNNRDMKNNPCIVILLN